MMSLLVEGDILGHGKIYGSIFMNTSFEWDEDKNADNLQNHGVNLETAQYAFIDPRRVIAEDLSHSKIEKRY